MPSVPERLVRDNSKGGYVEHGNFAKDTLYAIDPSW